MPFAQLQAKAETFSWCQWQCSDKGVGKNVFRWHLTLSTEWQRVVGSRYSQRECAPSELGTYMRQRSAIHLQSASVWTASWQSAFHGRIRKKFRHNQNKWYKAWCILIEQIVRRRWFKLLAVEWQYHAREEHQWPDASQVQSTSKCTARFGQLQAEPNSNKTHKYMQLPSVFRSYKM